MGEIIQPISIETLSPLQKKGQQTQWQLDFKTVDEKWKYIFNNELYTDTILLVGPEMEKIECHKILLILHSPVFETMLSTRWTTNRTSSVTPTSTNKEEFHLPEDDPKLIKLLISCFYNGALKEVSLTLELLLLAKKYICPHVISKCVQFLKSNTNERNAIQIYQTATLIEDGELMKHSENFVLSKACHLLKLDEFTNLNFEQLKYFLSHDDLNVDEVDLFNAVYKWGKVECERLEMDPNKNGNLTQVLLEIFPLIRFPCMSLEDFSVHVVSKNVLPLEQTVQVYKFLTTPSTKRNSISEESQGDDGGNAGDSTDKKSQPQEPQISFNTNARTMKIFSYIFKRLKGYGFNFGRKWQNLSFSVDHDIKLISLGFYRSVRTDLDITVGIKILSYDLTQVYSTVKDEVVRCNIEEDVFHVKFPKPVRIDKGTFYTISYIITGDDTLYKYGEPMSVQLACSADLKLGFTFKEALSDTDLDQVPEFCFQL